MSFAPRTGRGAGTCWNRVVSLNPGALATPVEILPGRRLVDREVVALRRAGKSSRGREEQGQRGWKRCNNNREGGLEGDGNVFCFYK